MSREGFVILKVKIEEEALINDTYQATKKSKMNDLKVVGMYDMFYRVFDGKFLLL